MENQTVPIRLKSYRDNEAIYSESWLTVAVAVDCACTPKAHPTSYGLIYALIENPVKQLQDAKARRNSEN